MHTASRRRRWSPIFWGLLWCGVGDVAPLLQAAEPDLETGVRLAREYLQANAEERSELAKDLSDYDAQWADIVSHLRPHRWPGAEPGYHPEEKFSVPALRERHPDDLLYFHVPRRYTPERAAGLIIFLHGGGAKTDRDAPHWTLRPLDDDEDDECSAMGTLFDEAGWIAVGPSAPWNRKSYYRWCLREADEYLADVILECKQRYHIDDHRVVLLGHSMGGFGAFHHVQRHPDRFAAVISHAGSWDLAWWPVIRGTRFCFINGVLDAEKGERWHYTDIAYARQTDRLLTEQGLDYVYYEHPGGHDAYHGKPYISKFLRTNQDLRRDPYFHHIAVATPVGYSRYHASPVRHNRWLSLNRLRPGVIEFDELITNDDDDPDFDDWELEHVRREREGSSAEARNLGNNTLEVTTQHVARFTVWLHPRMVDFRKPVRILVDGEERFHGPVAPSLVTALDSYLRRQDWGLIYPARVVLDCPED